MNMKKNLYVISAALAFAGVSFTGCSDDSSTGAGGGIDHGDEIEITIPDHKDSVIVDRKWDAESSEDEISSSSAKVPESSSSEEAAADWRDYCLEVINAKRATEDLKPLVRAGEEKEKCVIEQATKDMAAGKGHANFGDCKESAQNSGPNINPKWYKTEKEIVDAYVNMMWDDEKKLVTSGERDPNKDEDYSYIGHYLNMKNTRFTSVACGIAYSEDGSKAWLNINFY